MIETFLSIVSFSISVGGLVAILTIKGTKREVIVAVIVAALIATSGTVLYSRYQHAKYVDCIKKEIIRILPREEEKALTFDDLYQEIFPPVSHEVLREALYDGVEQKMIGYQSMRLQNQGRSMSTKVFYAR